MAFALCSCIQPHLVNNVIPPLFFFFAITSCSSLQSYHDPDSEDEDVRLASGIVAGASVTSGHEVSQPEVEKQTTGDGLEGEEKEDLPEQPPPLEEKPKEGKGWFLAQTVSCKNLMQCDKKKELQDEWLVS